MKKWNWKQRICVCLCAVSQSCMSSIWSVFGENTDCPQIEITIIGFLYNNPGKNTAAEIVELRMLPKGNVSQGVELLVKKGFLRRNTDRTDRRKVHLSLEETAIPLCNEIEKVNQSFKEQLLQGLTQQEKKAYEKINRQLMKNIEKGMNFNEK